MSRSTAPESPESGEPEAPDVDPAEAPPAAAPDQGRERPARPRSGLPTWVKAVAVALSIAAALLAVYAYRGYQERRIVALSIARADRLVRSDTWLGYHEAATLLGVRAASVDPVQAGAWRGLALAMLALDYRDEAAVAEANAALVAPTRAETVPAPAQLAVAALALRDGRAGTALEYLGRAGPGPLAQVLTARVALLAGNGALAGEALDRAVATDARHPAALALQGDQLRRAGRAREARDAYAAALASSHEALMEGVSGSDVRPGAVAPHARATLGLGKLALSREAPETEAAAALVTMVDDRAGTPQVERARAAMQLAALQARGGDRANATATLQKAGLEGSLHGWLERAAGQLEVAKGRYRVPDNTPAVLLSASDDDPYVPLPPPPPVAAAPPRQELRGFKVHPPAKAVHGGKAQTKRPATAKPAASGSAKSTKPAKPAKKKQPPPPSR